MGAQGVIETPAFVIGVYLLIGLLHYFWSEPYRPKSAAAFDACFRASPIVWVVMVAIAACIWPIIILNMTYRFFFIPKKEDKDGG
jgi:NADH:ubiquinone oxidoreductase subunit 5 (subunit L)/multisubunit Na+/H+ antiporter MnhA subunit